MSHSSGLGTLEMIARIETTIKNTKEHVNFLELGRVLAMVNSLKNDEDRLSKCIDDVEEFHRDLFVLPITVDKPSNTANESSMEDDRNSPEIPINAPGLFVNEQMSSMNQPNNPMEVQDYSMNQPQNPLEVHDCSMNQPSASRERLILRIPRSSVTQPANPQYEIESPRNEQESPQYVPMDQGNEPEFSTEEEDSSMSEENSFPERIIVKIPKSKITLPSSKKESDDGSGPSFSKDEPVDIEKEMAKNALMNLLADNEKEVTLLVVHAISAFSSFQMKLRTIEKTVGKADKSFPGNSNFNIKRTLNALSGSVLYIDKTLSKIYAKYSEMLQNLGNIFFNQQ